MMLIDSGRKARTGINLSKISTPHIAFRTFLFSLARPRIVTAIKLNYLHYPDFKVVPAFKTNPACAVLKVEVIYNSLLCLARLAQRRPTSLRSDRILWSGTTALPECKFCCMPQLLHVGRNIRKIFSRDILTTQFWKCQVPIFFFSFSEEPKTWHSPTCVSTEGGKVFCWLLPGKGNTFGSLKSRPVRNLCYGLNSRLNFTLANCCPDTMLNKFLFHSASSSNGGAAFGQLTREGRWGWD